MINHLHTAINKVMPPLSQLYRVIEGEFDDDEYHTILHVEYHIIIMHSMQQRQKGNRLYTHDVQWLLTLDVLMVGDIEGTTIIAWNSHMK